MNVQIPPYSQVTFSDIRYSEAWETGMKQDALIKNVMAKFDNIDSIWDSEEVEQAILSEI